jgi:hypothetical protein
MTTKAEMSGEELKDAAQFFWKKAHQQSLRLRQDPVQFAHVQEHFHESFRHMVSESQRRKIPILLCTVPVNLRDWLPTVSYNHLDGSEREQWQKFYNGARRCLLERNYSDGIQAIQRAISLEGEHAESYFWLGRLLEGNGQKAAALEAFSKARDLDYNPFRALSSFNDIIRTLARENDGKGVYLVDLERLFADTSTHAAPGFDLFLDYVHPTKPANLLIAQNIFKLLVGGHVLKDKSAVNHFSYHDLPTGPNKEPYRDETDVSTQMMELSLATINHQYETIVSRSEALVQQVSGRPLTGPSDPALTNCPPEFVERYVTFRNYVDVQRRMILNLPVSKAEQQEADQRVDRFYEKWYPLGRF